MPEEKEAYKAIIISTIVDILFFDRLDRPILNLIPKSGIL